MPGPFDDPDSPDTISPVEPIEAEQDVDPLSLPSLHRTHAEAGVQITRSHYGWTAAFGTGTTISYAFRSTTSPFAIMGHNAQATFTRSNAAQIDTITQVLALWSDVANIGFTRVGTGTSGAAAFSDNATILIGNYQDGNDNSGAFAFPAQAGATASSSASGDFWDNVFWANNVNPFAGAYGWITLIHELGHSLGLEHPGGYNAAPGQIITYAKNAEYIEDSLQYSVMSYFGASNTGANHAGLYSVTPLVDDIAAIQRLYGVNAATRTGNTIYGFNSNADRSVLRLASAAEQRVMTLYDAGGTDTLDLSGYATNQVINLNPGSYSSTGALTLNLSIALTTTIENAIGGAGNDTILANAANNAIDGGGGTDTVVLPGRMAEYTLSRTAGVVTVVDGVAGRGGTDTLTAIEFLQFSDRSIAASAIGAAGAAIAAADARKSEGSSGTTGFTFIVTRSGDVSAAVTLDYAVAGSGANPASAADFAGGALPSGILSFAANETSKSITVAVVGDNTLELDEGFTVTLTAPAGTTVTTPSAAGTILNDDASFTLAATDARKAEGNSGTTIFTFTFTRTGDTANAASLLWVVGASGAGSADTADFVGGALPTGSVAFAPGDTSKTISLAIAGDTLTEPDEIFTVSFLGGAGAPLAAGSASGTILNDDPALPLVGYTLTATDARKIEGNSGTTTFTFTTTRTGDLTASALLACTIAGSGTNPANAADFAGGVIPQLAVAFAAGEATRTITLQIAGDTLGEADETFTLTLNGPGGGSITAIGTILNDDTSYAITAIDAAKNEGNTGSTAFTFTVTRTGDLGPVATIGYAVTGAGSNTADAADFVGGTLPSGTVVFAAGEASRTITVPVAGDRLIEPDETFAVTLGGPAGTTFTTLSAQGTIRTDDTGPALGFDNATTRTSGSAAFSPASAGGPGYLQWEFIYTGSDSIAFATSAANTFIHAGSGNDAVQSGNGTNVLDGGLGSNFLTGGTGEDTFFTDARAPGVVWNTIRNFGKGDSATLWGFTDKISSYRWEDAIAGAPGSQGATLRANIVGGAGRSGDGIDASITFAGLSVDQAKGLQVAMGTQTAGNYLYLYNPGV